MMRLEPAAIRGGFRALASLGYHPRVPMIDWTLVTHDGNRRRQHEEFYVLSFREKLMVLEELERVAERFAQRASQEPTSVTPPTTPPEHD